MILDSCLPADLRGPATTLTPIGGGLSGAGVYRVEAGGHTYALKVSPEGDPVAAWRSRVEVQRLAASVGIAPSLIHVDESKRAVLSAFVTDRGFPLLFLDPRTRDGALTMLGGTIRRLHDLPIPHGASSTDPLAYLALLRAQLEGFAAPPFVDEATARLQAERVPEDGRADVLGHNDLNPGNLVYDGERILIVDWHTAGPMHPFYDLGAIAVFMRMDDATCLALLSAYEGAPVTALPARFAYSRRLVAVLCGTAFLHVARQSGHRGATVDDTFESTPSLGDFYQHMRTGAVHMATAGGQWTFGLALLKHSLAL